MKAKNRVNSKNPLKQLENSELTDANGGFFDFGIDLGFFKTRIDLTGGSRNRRVAREVHRPVAQPAAQPATQPVASFPAHVEVNVY